MKILYYIQRHSSFRVKPLRTTAVTVIELLNCIIKTVSACDVANMF